MVDFNHDFPDGSNPQVAARRLRSLKELYDPAWVPESWMSQLGDTDEYHYNKPQFIRRVRAWIAQTVDDLERWLARLAPPRG